MPFVWSVQPRPPGARPDAAVNPKVMKKAQLLALLDLEKSGDLRVQRQKDGSLHVWSVRMQWRYVREAVSDDPASPAAGPDP